MILRNLLLTLLIFFSARSVNAEPHNITVVNDQKSLIPLKFSSKNGFIDNPNNDDHSIPTFQDSTIRLHYNYENSIANFLIIPENLNSMSLKEKKYVLRVFIDQQMLEYGKFVSKRKDLFKYDIKILTDHTYLGDGNKSKYLEFSHVTIEEINVLLQVLYFKVEKKADTSGKYKLAFEVSD